MNPLEPFILKSGAIVLILGATYIGGCVRGSQIANDKLTEYRAQVEAAGKQAQKDAEIKAAKDTEKAHASDLSYAKALTVVGADIERLRKRTSSGADDLPRPSSTVCPEGLRCFDGPSFDSALRDFQGEVLTLVGEGATLKLRMDEAISWASRLNQ